MSSSSLGTILLEAAVGGQRVVGLPSIWLWSLQLQGETGTAAQGRLTVVQPKQCRHRIYRMEDQGGRVRGRVCNHR